MSTLIIAEAGVNHNGDLNIARQLIDVAAAAGADLVKFQTFSADRLVTLHARKAEYQQANSAADESQHAMLRALELTLPMHHALLDHCEQRGIGFFSTGFDVASLDLLAGLGARRFKIPSGEITNLPYLRHVGRFGKPVILSTGMSTLGEIEAALNVLEGAGTARDKVTVLHCNTEYPTPMRDVNLRAMLSIREAFGVAVGYSDHTAGTEVAIAAVALGASIIEKHFTLDRRMPGPDHQASLEPAELQSMVRQIRNIEQALGTGRKAPSASEAKNMPIARKSIVATRPIRAGERFTVDNITVKRPGVGISPMRWDEVLGRAAVRAFVADELIEL
ncbi:MAG: N-acetylneuraminate synthase [Proteobacteria bacterium]|nr:N-acetylneuraminate synthase [Pseudomonadota bacterium]